MPCFFFNFPVSRALPGKLCDFYWLQLQITCKSGWIAQGEKYGALLVSYTRAYSIILGMYSFVFMANTFLPLARLFLSGATFFDRRDFFFLARLFLSGATFFLWRDFFSLARLFFAGATFFSWRDSFFISATFSQRRDFFSPARLFLLFL